MDERANRSQRAEVFSVLSAYEEAVTGHSICEEGADLEPHRAEPHEFGTEEGRQATQGLRRRAEL